MRCFLPLILSLFLSKDVLAQKLTAKVIDENNEPLDGATVYFDGTIRGVITNVEGIFHIILPDNLT